MEIMTIEMLKECLDSEMRPDRFRIKHLDQGTVAKMLTLCYQHEVSKRRKNFIEDPVLLGNIGRAAKWLTGNFSFGLMIYGSVGNGKTTLANSICSLIKLLYGEIQKYEERKGVVSISALDVASKVKNDPGYVSVIRQKELLFIDDLGVEPETVKSWGNEISPITDILYYRYDQQLFTIVSSNLSDDALKKRYGERIASRMDEMFECIHFSGESYRK